MAKKLHYLPILLILLVMVFTGSFSADKTEAGNKIADGIFLGDQDLSGKTMNEAADAMEAYYEKIAASDLTINVRKLPDEVLKKLEAGQAVDTSTYDIVRSVKVPVSTFDFDYSIEEALRVATTLGQTGKLVERYKTLMDMKYGRAQLPLSYSVDGEKVKEYVDKVFAPENTREAVDAKFSWGKDGLQVRQNDQDGLKVYNNLTAASILQAFDEGLSDSMSCTAAVGTVSASVTAASLTNIKFSKVASYTTRFWRGNGTDEASANRSHNIDLAAKYVNGTMVTSGQRVSLNQLIGMRTPERGFKVAGAFYNGKVVQDLGGGICQFATTLYQCLLQTELQINVRYNHSLAVSYIGYSQDATLDWGYCDLIFTNTWNNPIYIECSTTYNTVTVSFYGVDERPKNRTVEYKTVVDEEIKTLYPAIVLEEDDAPGTPKREGETMSAIRSHIDKIVRVNGVVQSTTKMNNDYYRPLRTFVHVGTKGITLTVKRVDDIDQIYDKNGNQLLLNSRYEPIYNGNGGYYLAKDYKHDANGVAVYSGGKLVPIGSGSTTPTQPTTPPTTEAPTTPPTQPTQPSSSETQPTTPPTQPSTEPTTPPTTAHEHSWGEWSKWTHIDGSAPSKHSRTRSCTSCSDGKETQEVNCTFDKVETVPPTTTSGGYTLHTCSDCGFSYKDNYVDPIQPVTTTAPETTQAPDPGPGEGGGEGGNP